MGSTGLHRTPNPSTSCVPRGHGPGRATTSDMAYPGVPPMEGPDPGTPEVRGGFGPSWAFFLVLEAPPTEEGPRGKQGSPPAHRASDWEQPLRTRERSQGPTRQPLSHHRGTASGSHHGRQPQQGSRPLPGLTCRVPDGGSPAGDPWRHPSKDSRLQQVCTQVTASGPGPRGRLPGLPGTLNKD